MKRQFEHGVLGPAANDTRTEALSVNKPCRTVLGTCPLRREWRRLTSTALNQKFTAAVLANWIAISLERGNQSPQPRREDDQIASACTGGEGMRRKPSRLTFTSATIRNRPVSSSNGAYRRAGSSKADSLIRTGRVFSAASADGTISAELSSHRYLQPLFSAPVNSDMVLVFNQKSRP